MAKQYFIPGTGFINETGDKEYFVPEGGVINETSSSGPVLAPVNLQNISVTQLPAQGLYVYRRKFPVLPDERVLQSQLYKRKFPKVN